MFPICAIPVGLGANLTLTIWLDCTPNFFYTQYMFTLSDASTDTKKVLEVLGIIVGVILTIFVIYKIVLFVKEIFYPTPPPKPTVAFGLLQPQVFPSSVSDKTFSYSINTLTGGLPQFPNQARVYTMQAIQPDLLAVKKFEEKVIAVNYDRGYTAISDKVFEWKSSKRYGEIEKRIRTNIVDGSFKITSDYMLDKDILSAKNLPTQEKAISIAQSMLGNMQMIPDDIDLSKNKTNLFSVNNSTLLTASSLSNSQVIEVNFFQKDVNKLPIYYEKPFSSNISILVAGGSSLPQIVGANYIHQSISNQSSTYPIKTANQAFDELNKGKAYIGSYFGSLSNINITDISLGYYIGSNLQDYMMPIFVFKGGDGFSAYVPAITDVWINK